MSEEMKTIIDSSYDKGLDPLWLYTDDYIYGMIPADDAGNRWTEVAYTFELDDPLNKNERSADFSYQFLFEELEKGVSFYIKDFNVNELKNFSDSINDKSGPEKMKALINDLINNTSKYSDNLPIVKSKDGLSKLKEKL
ncbi:MAG: hypothetical protein GF383_01235 [Candidatus Lokiarchaeota archaeon]|nr:hypothetical protein [Candidatus Lokiarchaeota archaeon]MBD3337874.1 hypothetical protein [Candidatus Lokiarchaeota archaeon]